MYAIIKYMNTKYTKEILCPLVANSISVAEVIKKLGLKLSGGNHSHLTKVIKKHGISTIHFLGQAARKGKQPGNKKSWEELLTIKKGDRRQDAYILRRALIESGREYRCEVCGQGDVWNNKPLTLEVHHKNRNGLDNRAENLSFMCPNCHSQEEKIAQ
jgi:predicted RNA-binding Zn-ribbon protein involved in translation (DUF1610 family)